MEASSQPRMLFLKIAIHPFTILLYFIFETEFLAGTWDLLLRLRLGDQQALRTLLSISLLLRLITSVPHIAFDVGPGS